MNSLTAQLLDIVLEILDTFINDKIVMIPVKIGLHIIQNR